MEYAIIVVILAVIVYMLTRKKKEKPPIEPPIEDKKEEQKEEKKKEDKKEVVVKTEQKVYWIKDGKKEWGIAKYMPQGLQVFDEQGNCILDITDRLTRILDTVTVTGKNKEDEDIVLEKEYHIGRGQKIWWTVLSANDFGNSPIPGGIFAVGAMHSGVKISYTSPTLAKAVFYGSDGDEFVIGVY